MKNEFLTVETTKQGAEARRILGNKNGTEFLFNADERHWNFCAPILFPFVGRVKDGKYMLDGKEYESERHGFARFVEFELVKEDDKSVKYILRENAESLKMYPYKFEFEVEYILSGNELETKMTVRNTDSKVINFGLGGHPAYMCPIKSGESFEDCYLEFEKKETAEIRKVNTSEGILSGERELYLKNENVIDLNYGIFANDALVFEHLKSNKVCLKSRKSESYLEFDFSGFEFLGIWTKKDAPFVCIEPWTSHADEAGKIGDFRDKEGHKNLEVGEEFTISYKVKFFEV